MLVLTRKSQESVIVGGAGFEPLLIVRVLEVGNGKVRLGFEVDKGVPVHRAEVWQRLHAGAPAGPAGVRAPPVAE